MTFITDYKSNIVMRFINEHVKIEMVNKQICFKNKQQLKKNKNKTKKLGGVMR